MVYIICAAIWVKDPNIECRTARNIEKGEVVTGYRHGNCYAIISRLYDFDKEKGYPKYYLHWEKVQGFLTSEGTFVDRKEAAKIAFQAKQIKTEKTVLYSEDLY